MYDPGSPGKPGRPGSPVGIKNRLDLPLARHSCLLRSVETYPFHLWDLGILFLPLVQCFLDVQVWFHGLRKSKIREKKTRSCRFFTQIISFKVAKHLNKHNKSSLCVLTSEELHEVSGDIAIGTDDPAVTRWPRGSRWTRRALNRSHICLQWSLDNIFLQQALICRDDLAILSVEYNRIERLINPTLLKLAQLKGTKCSAERRKIIIKIKKERKYL